MFGIQIFCSCCGKIFGICRHCFRNHKYCSDECRSAGYSENHRRAQKKYSSKKEVKQKHAENMRRRRKNPPLRKKVAYQASKTCMCIMMVINSLFFQLDFKEKKGICANCGNTFGKIIEYREPLDDEDIIFEL
jgi:hypothetical protein